MISIESKGSFDNLEAFLTKAKKGDILPQLERYGQMGVAALLVGTPAETGLTALSWDYQVVKKGGVYSIWWINTHMDDDGQVPVAILLQYGHGTGSGGYVQGRDFINPAIRPVMDQIAADVWRVVTSA